MHFNSMFHTLKTRDVWLFLISPFIYLLSYVLIYPLIYLLYIFIQLLTCYFLDSWWFKIALERWGGSQKSWKTEIPNKKKTTNSKKTNTSNICQETRTTHTINNSIISTKVFGNISSLGSQKLSNQILQQNKTLKLQLEKMKKKLETIEEKLKLRTFSTDILKDDTNCQHYTSLPNYRRMEVFLDFLAVGEDGRNLRMRGSEEGGKGRPRSLKPEEQLFMALVKLKRGFSNVHLAWLFNCAESTVSKIITSWINYIYLRVSTLPIWPSREEINESMPEAFKEFFSKNQGNSGLHRNFCSIARIFAFKINILLRL